MENCQSIRRTFQRYRFLVTGGHAVFLLHWFSSTGHFAIRVFGFVFCLNFMVAWMVLLFLIERRELNRWEQQALEKRLFDEVTAKK